MMQSEREISFIGASALVILLSIGVIISIFIQQRQLKEVGMNAFENNVRKLLPIAQEQTKPINTATNLILKRLRDVVKNDKTPIIAISEGFMETFGKDSGILLTDSNHQIIFAKGLNPQEKNDFRIFLKDFYSYHLPKKPHITAETKSLVKKYFEETISYDQMPNMINTLKCRKNGVEGLGVFATLIRADSPKSLDKEFAKFVSSDLPKDDFKGSLFIFIPEENYENINFLKQNFVKASNESFTNSKFGEAIELENHLTTINKDIARSFSESSRNTLQGVFRHADTFFGFSRIELKKKEVSENDVFLLFSIQKQRKQGSLIHYLALALILINLAVFIFLGKQIHSKSITWSWNLNSKFVILAIISCLIPIAGLLYQSYLKHQLEESAIKREQFLELEKKLVALENRNKTQVSDLMTKIRLFNEKIESMETLDQEAIQEIAYGLKQTKIIQVYIADENGSIKEYNTQKGWHSNNTRAGTRIVFALIKFIKKNIQFKTNQAEKKKESVTEGIIVEEAADGMGMETLYQLAIRYFELVPFKMLHASVWSCVTMQLDEDKNPKRLLMFIVNKTPLMTRQIDSVQREQSPKFPELLFVRRTLLPIEEVGPNALETNPDQLSMLQSLNKAGGVINVEIKIDGENLFIAGRRLSGMDWTCLAVSRKKSDKTWILNPSLIFTFAVLSYLALLIFFLSKWIQRFFLRPVLSLTQNAMAIAEGNYEISIDCLEEDEIGFLSKSFAEMAADLKEKEFLNRFISDIARDAISGSQTTRATKIEATVLFSDIRNFTTLSEQHAPEEIALMLNSYLTLMETVIEKHTGSIEKFIGDAIMAVFLPRLGMPHPAERAALAAKEMMQFLQSFNIERKQQNQFTISTGAGIASGELLMGTMGNLKGRRDYTVTGSTVNLAAEMEKLSKLATKIPIVLCPDSITHITEAGISFTKIEANGEIRGYELG